MASKLPPLQRFKSLHTNENILIAMDGLLHSKAVFVTTFLMTYMIRMSVSDSPDAYISYRLLAFIFMGVFSVILLPFLKRFTLASWRLGALLSVVQIGVIMMWSELEAFPLILALITSVESTLYWRPNSYFSIVEVRNERRLRFQSIKQIVIEVVKIVSPIALGLLISDSGFSMTATVILAISIIQLFVSMLFRPRRKIKFQRHRIRPVMRHVFRNSHLQKIFVIQFLRGFMVSGAAYLIIPTLLVYSLTSSDMDLGIYTSIGAALAIALILTFRTVDTKYGARWYLVISSIPAFVLPMLLVFMSDNVFVTAVFFIYSVAVLESLFNVFLTNRYQGSIRRNVLDDTYRLEVESIAEVFLCSGRVLSMALLLAMVVTTGVTWLPIFAAVCSLVLVPIILISTTARIRELEIDEAGLSPVQ